jgi:hypothetical protein
MRLLQTVAAESVVKVAESWPALCVRILKFLDCSCRLQAAKR